jgi:antitoxin component YwqK of YwqJK toxin-antitoxin module
MKALKAAVVGLMAVVCMVTVLVVTAKAEEFEQTSGKSVTAVYNYQGGMMVSVANPVNNSVTRYFGNMADSVVRIDGSVETLLSKYNYDKAGKLATVQDCVSGAVSYYNENGKSLFTATGEAKSDEVKTVLSLADKSNLAEAYKAASEYILSKQVFGITSLNEYSSSGAMLKEHNYAAVAAGTTLDGTELSSNKVVETSYTTYKDGKPNEVYSLYAQKDANGNEITAESYTSMTDADKAKITWSTLSAPQKTAKYNYTGNTLNSVDYYNASGEVSSREIYKNGKISEIQSINNGVATTAQKYIYDGARLVRIDSYADDGSKVESSTFMDKFGRQSYVKDDAGQVLTSWEYNDTGKDQTVTITNADAVAELEKMGYKAVNGAVQLTMKAGQTMRRVTSSGTDATVANVTYFNKTNQALISVECAGSNLTTTGTAAPKDPVATGVLSVNDQGQVVMTIDVSTMYDPTGKVSKAELVKMYDPDGDGKAQEIVQTLDADKLAAERAKANRRTTIEIDAKSLMNQQLSKQIMSDAIQGNTATLFWNWTAQKDGQTVIFVEKYW